MSIDTRIEYVTSEPGVSLACTKFGSGPALIYQFANPSLSHFEMELAFEPAMRTYEQFAEVATVIRYDPRNTGLSTRGIDDISLDAQIRDLEAVMRHYGIGSAALMFPFLWATVAAAFAAANPERVSALVLPYPILHRERQTIDALLADVYTAAMKVGFEFFWSVRALTLVGLDAGENAAWMVKYMIEAADDEEQLRGEQVFREIDARAAAAAIRAPTLIVQRKLPRFNAGTKTAEMIREHRASITRTSALIPGAETALFEGSSLWYTGDEAITARSLDFLRKVWASQSADGESASRTTHVGGLRTVLFTDIVGHTEMMQRLGDARGRDVLREHERITRDTLKQHGGAEVKTMGDGFMASFGSVTGAVECAIALQRAFAAHSHDGEELSVRVGLNAGEPIEEDGDLFGATVILASRIAAKASGGEILVPEPVRHLLAGKPFAFADRGQFALKGFDDAVRLYEVRWEA